MRVRDLGSLAVDVDAADRPVSGTRAAAILALLVININRRVTGEALMDAAWGDQITPGAASTLLSHIWRLRQLLEPTRGNRQAPSVLISDDGGYRLIGSAQSLDSLSFEQLAGEVRDLLAAGRAAHAVTRAEEALALWRGRPYGALAEQDWAAASVARLDELHDQVLERRVEALLAAGDLDRALSDVEPLIAATPFRERLWGLRMLALYRSGRAEEALQTFTRVRATLLEDLGTQPGSYLQGLQRQILDHDPALTPRAPAATSAPPRPVEAHLPTTLTPLVGRADDLAAVREQLGTQPLVTIVGPAGCGKTRLAVDVARAGSDRFADGVWFVDLNAVSDADLVVDVVISTIGFASSPAATPLEEVRHYLRGRRVLLVLDNCEHVLGAAAELVEVALGADDPAGSGVGSCILATSREPLGIAGETIWTLPPLAVPDDASRDPRDAPAVELFLQRLRAHAPAMEFDAEALALAADISRAVDGLPLALELAAARGRTATLHDIAAQVRSDPSRLRRVGRGPADHRTTIGSAIEWSHRLLAAPERTAHRRLAILPGPFGRDLAAAVIGDVDGSDADDLLAQLGHRSMLTVARGRGSGGPTRFAQLATARAHAHHKLIESGEHADTIRRRNAWVERLIRSRPRLGRPAEFEWHQRVDHDYAAVRATLTDLLLERRDPLAARLAGRLTFHWYHRGRMVEAARWMPLAHDALRDGEAVDALLVRASYAAVLTVQGRVDLARPHIDRVLGDLADVPSARLIELGEALVGLTEAAWIPDDLALFAELHGHLAAVAGRADDAELQPVCDALGSAVLLAHGRVDEAGAAAEAAHARAVEIDNLMASWIATSTLALTAMALGRPADGIPWSDRTLDTHRRVGAGGVGMFIETRANLFAASGDFATAARLYASARAHARRAAMAWPRRRAITEPLLERTREHLRADDYARAWQSGEQLSLDQLVRETQTAS